MARFGGFVRRLTSRRGTAVPDTICPLPWVNLSLDVDGSSRPCCKFAHQTDRSRYQLASLEDHGLDEVWNSDSMVRLRSDFRRGSKPDECRSCWDEERAGIASFRQTYLGDRGIGGAVDFDDLRPAAPRALDLKLSNACNLKCRICGPIASSLWLSEELRSGMAAGPDRDALAERQGYLRSEKITASPPDLATFRTWVPHLEHLELTGGEPMLSAENRDVLELVVAEGAPERVSLLLTTNAVVMDERILSTLPRFRSVTISLSIDDIEGRLEYQRSPCHWERVQANVDRYAALASPSIEVFTNCTVSAFNVWYLPEYLSWLHQRYPRGEITFNLNLLHGPRHFSVQVLPPPVKDAVRARLADVAADDHHPEPARRQIRELIEFMGSTGRDDRRQWAEGVATIRRRDAIRDERFEHAHAEWHHLLQGLGAWPEPEPHLVPDPTRATAR